MDTKLKEHEWTDSDGTRWKATDYGCIVYSDDCIVYSDDGKWVSPIDPVTPSHEEILRLASMLRECAEAVLDYQGCYWVIHEMPEIIPFLHEGWADDYDGPMTRESSS